MRSDPKRPRPIPAPEDYDRVTADEDASSPYEPTYRDGSVRHECWDSDG